MQFESILIELLVYNIQIYCIQVLGHLCSQTSHIDIAIVVHFQIVNIIQLLVESSDHLM